MTEVFKCGSCTQFEVINLRYTWAINSFTDYYSKKFELKSPIFSSGTNNDKSKWCLILFPRMDRDQNNYRLCQLKLVACDMEELYAEIIFTTVNVKVGRSTVGLRGLCRFDNDTTIFWGLSSFWTFKEKINDYLVEDKFTIICEINYTVAVNGENISPRIYSNTSQNFLAIDLTFLLENKELSDVTLSAGGKEFPAHKVILAARSSVFRTMFQNDMEESRKNRVEITDIDEEGVCEMLRYMYTDKVNKLEKIAPCLLRVADKYAMDDLTIVCENAMLKNLSLENAVRYFILSDMFRAKELKIGVKKFIVSNAAAVTNTPEFHKMVRTHPHLGMEACCVISVKSPIL